MFRYGAELGPLAAFSALQAELSESAADKVPVMHSKGCLYTRRGLEQSSSEATAAYKAGLFSGERILVLASGLGVDDMAFSDRFKEVISVDPDAWLNGIARYNFGLTGKDNITRLDTDAGTFLASDGSRYDLVYIDPDRRANDKRQILLRDHSPDVTALLPELFRVSDRVMIKCSPLYDHEMALREVKGITAIYSISLDGEMKEMLLVAEKGRMVPEPEIKVICCDMDREGHHTGYAGLLRNDALPTACQQSGKYLMEAGSCLVKMRKHHAFAAENNWCMLSENAPYYCSDSPPGTFPGKTFRILEKTAFTASGYEAYFKSAGITQANVKTRGLAFNTAALAKKLKLKDGGDDFIFVLPLLGKATLFHCRRV